MRRFALAAALVSMTAPVFLGAPAAHAEPPAPAAVTPAPVAPALSQQAQPLPVLPKLSPDAARTASGKAHVKFPPYLLDKDGKPIRGNRSLSETHRKKLSFLSKGIAPKLAKYEGKRTPPEGGTITEWLRFLDRQVRAPKLTTMR